MFKLLKNLHKKDVLMILISFLLIWAQVWLELKMPDYMQKITVLVKTEGSLMKDILLNGFYMLSCAFGSLVSAIIVGYIVAHLSSNFSLNIRSKVFNKVCDMSMSEVHKLETSSLITRTTNDITQVEMFLSMGLQLLIKAPLTAIWAITKILNKSVTWSIYTAVAVAILLTVIGILTIIAVPKFKMVQKLIDKVNNAIRENLTGIRVVRAFNAEKYEENKFNKVNKNLTNTQMFTQKAFSIMAPIMYLVMHTLALTIYLTGAYMIDGANLSDKLTLFGNMIVFSSYALQVIMSFLMLAAIFMIWPRASVSAKRINEVLDEDIKIVDGDINKSNKNKGEIEFKNVSFKYPDAEDYLLKNISFKAKAGETIAFIGSTGCGKSTLVNLIPRFYDATDGEILIDGINVKDYTQELLHDKIGYVPQRPVIFSGDIESNVTYGCNKKVPTNKVLEALDVAQALDFVMSLDDKLKTPIAQSGTNLSGGQKQRIAIARAIVRDPEIYIFDDSFSALDYKTDTNLRKKLKSYTKSATSIIVAQRIGTIMNADQIIVLDNGKCVGHGTHKELLKTCEVYKQIALSQLSKEELENA